jgi:hypothetical protein
MLKSLHRPEIGIFIDTQKANLNAQEQKEKSTCCMAAIEIWSHDSDE